MTTILIRRQILSIRIKTVLNSHYLNKNNSVVAIETLVSMSSRYAMELNDGWTMVGRFRFYLIIYS